MDAGAGARPGALLRQILVQLCWVPGGRQELFVRSPFLTARKNPQGPRPPQQRRPPPARVLAPARCPVPRGTPNQVGRPPLGVTGGAGRRRLTLSVHGLNYCSLKKKLQ